MALPTPEGYQAYNNDTIAGYIAGLPKIKDHLGGGPDAWTVNEVGDGNLNLVFIIEGPKGDICVKQALPYVRLVGEGWPLPLDRAYFEHAASIQERALALALVPEIFHYDPKLYLIVMERLSPHIIMRKGMIAGQIYPKFTDDMAAFCARTLFGTSDLAMPAAEKKALIAKFCGNTELCKITEDLIFTDPYMVHERNRWTSPQLDEDARKIRGDDALKRAVSKLKYGFLTKAQALLHGDLHTGSIMVTEAETKVIDPEFAFVGPIGFDVGKLIGNLLLCYFAQTGHATAADDRREYRRWIVAVIEGFWHGFQAQFIELWNSERHGDAFPPALFDGDNGLSMRQAQHSFMRDVFEDALGYAGTSMIRRTLGLAHNADLETIEDPDVRAACERKVLAMGRDLILQAQHLANIEAVTAKAVMADGLG